jgi:hypothetical protein
MEAVRAIYRSAAEKENVISLNEEIYVLEADLLRIVIAAVDQMTAKLPLC